MKKENVLELEFTRVWDKWAWRITKQDENILTRIGFKDENLNVISSAYPCYSVEIDRLFLRGVVKKKDNNVCICTMEEKALIEGKVRLINEKYGKFKFGRFEREKTYFYINAEGKIYQTAECFMGDDNRVFDLKNYFPTRKLAQECLENYIKPAFQKFWEDKDKGED